MAKRFISQDPIEKRVVPIVDEYPDTGTIYRSAVHHFDRRKAGIADGVTSSTSLFDETFGEVPQLFKRGVDNFELADALIARGVSSEQASKAASSGTSDTGAE